MRKLHVLVLALASIVTGCGGSSADSGFHARGVRVATVAGLPRIVFKSDADMDSDSYGTEPDDESEPFGHPASAADARAIAALVRRYYAAAVRDNGAAACRLLYSSLAESVPEDYGQSSGPAGLHGKTCAVVLSKLFAQTRERLRADSVTLRVVAVRVDLKRGSARLSFGMGKPSQYMLLHRERGAWKTSTLLAVGRPVGVE